MKKLAITICLLVYSFSLCFSQVTKHNLKITYISNEGFLLTSTNHKILIDGLYSEGYGIFSVPPKEVTDKIMNAEAPFDNIEMLMLTHYHKDHCDPVLNNQYLSKYKNVRFVTTKQSVVFIDGNCFGFIGKKKQFDIITRALNQSVSKIVDNVPINAFGLKHLSFYNKDSVNLEETIFKVSFLFEIDGIKIFHSGDTEMDAFQDYLKEHEWTDSVDVAFLYKGLFKSGEKGLDYILNLLHPKYIVIMHVQLNEAGAWVDKVDKLKTRFPNIIYFRNPMDSITISIDKN